MRKIVIIIIMFLFFINPVLAKENDNKVYDYSSVLTEEQEKKLKEECNKYINKNNTDIALITLRYTDIKTLEEYSKKFYTTYNVGNNNNGNGIIFVINTNDIDYHIYTSGDLDKYYNDNNIKYFIDEIENETDYNLIFTKFLKNNTDYNKIYIKDILIVLSLSIIITIIVLNVLFRSNKLNKIKEEKILKINRLEEKFIKTETKKIK